MATTYKSLGNTDLRRLNRQAKGERKATVAETKKSVAVVDKTANNAKSTAMQMYKASKNRLGDVSQTTKNKLDVGYGNNVSTINTARTNAKNLLMQNRAQNLSKMRQSYHTQKGASKLFYGKKNLAEKVEKRTQNLKNYSSTISRFDTIKKCDTAIKKLKKSDDPDRKEKIAYIRAQRATLLAEQKKSSGSGGGGWHSWGGRGWRSYGSGSGSGDADISVESKTKDTDSNSTKKKTNSSLEKYASLTSKEHYGEPIVKDSSTTTTKKKTKKSVARNRNSVSRHWHL